MLKSLVLRFGGSNTHGELGLGCTTPSTNHKKTKIFNELFLLLEDLRIFLCFWMRMEMFSLAGSIILDSWGTETKMIEIYHIKWKTSLQFHLFPPVIQRVIIFT